MTKILPLAEPIIKTYPVYANPLAILGLDYQQTAPWLLNNLLIMQSDFFVDDSKARIFFRISAAQTLCDKSYLFDCPFLTCDSISREFIDEFGLNIIDVIKSYISRNYYCYMYVARSPIASYNTVDKLAAHDIFIYGFDDSRKSFYAMDYFSTTYESQLISYDEFTNAYKNYVFNQYSHNFKELLFISREISGRKKHEARILLNEIPINQYITITISRLNEHLGLVYNKMYMRKGADYGVKIYDIFVEYLQHKKCYICHYGIIAFSFLKEHKNVMIRLCEFYDLDKILIKEWTKLYQLSSLALMLYVKMLLKSQNGALIDSEKHDLIVLVKEMKSKDENLSKKVLTCLNEKLIYEYGKSGVSVL